MSFLAGPLDGKEQMVSLPKIHVIHIVHDPPGGNGVTDAPHSWYFQQQQQQDGGAANFGNANILLFFLLFVNIDRSICLLSGCELFCGSKLSSVGVPHPLSGAST